MAMGNAALRCVDEIEEQLNELPQVPQALRETINELRQAVEALANAEVTPPAPNTAEEG